MADIALVVSAPVRRAYLRPAFFWGERAGMRFMTSAGVALLLVLAGCQAASRRAGANALSGPAAIELAVALANEECETAYSTKPFDTLSYPVVFDGSKWHWGALDAFGVRGYSALVSFGPSGEDSRVEVFFSEDRVRPAR